MTERRHCDDNVFTLFQFLIVVECVFCVVSTPGENKHTLAPPGGTGETPSGPGIRHERAAPDTAYNTSGTMTIDMIIKYSCSAEIS